MCLFFTCRLAVLALLTSCIQVSQASNITSSSTVLPSGTVQRNTTANSSYESQTTTLASNIFTSVLQNSSVSVKGKTSTFLWYSTSLGFGGTTTLPSTTSVTSNYSSTRITTSPTTVLVVTGLPDGKVIAVIAGILGALLLILLGVIVSSAQDHCTFAGVYIVLCRNAPCDAFSCVHP